MQTKHISNNRLLMRNLFPSHLSPMRALALTLALCAVTSCEEFVDVDPPRTGLISETVFSDDATATSAMTGIYSVVMSASNLINSRITLLTGVSSDEMKSFATSGETRPFFDNAVVATNFSNEALWNNGFKYIFQANSVMEGLAGSTSISSEVKKQLQGEAKFFRAFTHFYLVNLFGDIPYMSTTNYQVNSVAPRLPKSEVYEKIIADLLDAKALLSDSYVSSERARPNKWAATALLARVYLYNQQWANAEAQATEVINTPDYVLVPTATLSNVFLKNSPETIWQLVPLSTGMNTLDGNLFVLTAAPTIVALTQDQVGAFEVTDGRRASWTKDLVVGASTYTYPFKYKIKTSAAGVPRTEYLVVLRLAEQYLIRAEARAQQNNTNDAVADLNVIRERAGGLAPLANTLTQGECLTAVERERRVELFVEMGHRWFDLKRTGRADAVLGAVKAGWETTDQLFPIPKNEILKNLSSSQNPGY